MATTTQKEANTSSSNSQNYKTFLGARVLWPPDVEDDILEGAILETHNIIRDKTKDGQAVRLAPLYINYLRIRWQKD